MPDKPCPNCGTMRPEAATFCANCGQDLRPGASLGDMRPGATIVRKLPPGSGPRGPSAGQGPPSALLGAAAPPPTTPPKARAKAGGSRLPRLGRGTAAAPPKPTPPAAPDTRSFTDRYRGTTFETPEAKAARPARSTPRWLRPASVLVIVVAVLAVAGYGALQVLSAPAAVVATPSGSVVAQASPTPTVPAITPLQTVTFPPGQQAEVAFCLAGAETHGLDADIAAARAAVTAADHATVAADATALVARIAEMRLAAKEMAALPLLAQYAAAYDTALKAAGSAAAALAAAGTASNAKAEGTASTALAAAQPKVDATSTRTALVAANPVLACTAAG
ncbi:MAG TPA: zinc ribbon domain-containing protein [Candidatus Sulfotelmatobacter sp.]|nr:zinc ribbon domain-containing protein [Candidatus Sulfotelmatobacter sp.]